MTQKLSRGSGSRRPVDTSKVLFPVDAVQGQRFATRVRGQCPLFVCVIASTDTALEPGISAAGASLELIPYTPAADAEVVAYGQARCIAGVPSNPSGPPGPALITRAALTLARIPHLIVDAGCHVLPDVQTRVMGCRPGGMIADGGAVPAAGELFAAGQALGRSLARDHPYLVVGESVPGGTTTALALLLALGYRAEGRVSSSLAGNPHALKNRVARRALAHLSEDADPLAAVATLGDPMQPVVAGLAAGALEQGTPVLLAGGTQMVAVVALLKRLGVLTTTAPASLAVATTRWVVEDPSADIVGLLQEVAPIPLLATALSFADARQPGLRAYEDYLVKEGVGAGGAATAAYLGADIEPEHVRAEVERLYDAMLTSTSD